MRDTQIQVLRSLLLLKISFLSPALLFLCHKFYNVVLVLKAVIDKQVTRNTKTMYIIHTNVSNKYFTERIGRIKFQY